jgi:hypothetical protein
MLFTNRSRTGPDPTLRYRAALFVVGVGVILSGMRFGKPWAVNVGIGVLLVAVLIRLTARRRQPPDRDATD